MDLSLTFELGYAFGITALSSLLGFVIFKQFLKPLSCKTLRQSDETTILYRHFRYVEAAVTVWFLLNFALWLYFVLTQPQAPETWFASSMTAIALTATLVLGSNTAISKTIVHIGPKHLDCQQRLRWGFRTQNMTFGPEIVSAYYLKDYHKWGYRFSLFVNTTSQSNLLILDRINDEDVVVLIKDEIISRYNLTWSSRKGHGPLIERTWLGTRRNKEHTVEPT